MTYFALMARCLIGLVFAVSAVTKLRSRLAFREFSAWMAALPGLPGRGRFAIAVAVAVAEAVIMPLMALPWTFVIGLAVATAVLAAFTVGTFLVARSRAGAAPCQCFGPSSTPLGVPHVIRNALLCAAAAIGAAGVGPAADGLPRVALSLGIGAAVALPTIFFDDLIAVFVGGGNASGDVPTRQAATQPGNVEVRS